jgi:hypothetical protein
MEKLILLSIILFTTIVPLATSAAKRPDRTLRKVQWATFVFTFVWAYCCRRWYPQLVNID